MEAHDNFLRGVQEVAGSNPGGPASLLNNLPSFAGPMVFGIAWLIELPAELRPIERMGYTDGTSFRNCRGLAI
jgi:hypothetical protein